MKKLQLAIFAATLLLVAGCGSGRNSMFTDGQPGNVAGYIFTASYNSSVAAARPSGGRSAAAGVPSGYVAVSGATVTFASLNKSVTTDANGYFLLSDINPGTTTLTVTKTGMETKTITVNVPKGDTADINAQNSPDAISMTPASTGSLVVTATSGSGVTALAINGATVVINGVATSKTTPATITDIAQLPAGQSYTVTVTINGYNTPLPQSAEITSSSPVVSLTFDMVPSDGNYAPRPVILLPANGTAYQSGAGITFSGTAQDQEDGALTGGSLVWTSSIDNTIGTGQTFELSTLQAGTHTITLTATDLQGKSSSTSVTISVTDSGTPNQAPSATIITPLAGFPLTSSNPITFTGTGIDPEETTLTGDHLVWSSYNTGTGQITNIGTGNYATATLPVGTYDISLTVTDSGGLFDTATRSITVN